MMELEGDLQYLWKPKKTLRDWGKTEYKIVRNWTPHSQKTSSATTTNSQQLSSITTAVREPPHDTQTTSTEHNVEQPQTTSKHKNYRRSTRKHSSIPLATHIGTSEEGINDRGGIPGPHDVDNDDVTVAMGDHDDVTVAMGDQPLPTTNLHTLSPDVSQHIRTSLLSLRQLRHSQNDDDSAARNESAVNVHQSTTTGSSGSQTLVGTCTRVSSRNDGSGERDRDADIVEDSEEEVVMDTEEELGSKVSGSGGGERDGTGIPNGAERVNVHFSSDDERVNVSEEAGVIRAKKSRNSKRGKNKRPTKSVPNTGGSRVVKLWQSKHIHRSDQDLSELDVCLTVYDQIIQEKLCNTESEMLQRVLATHWKHTRRSMLHLIRDAHTVQALDKRHKQEKRKQKKLQKEMTGVLSNLRKTNSRYQESVSKAKEMKQKQEVVSLQEEIEALTQKLQPILGPESS